MKRMYTYVLLLAATLCPLASSVSAEEIVRAKVPFAFSVSNRTLPAGEYRLMREGEFLRIENSDDHRSVYVITYLAAPSGKGKSYLSFDQVNGVFFLRRVVTSYGPGTLEFPVKNNSKSERRIDALLQSSFCR